MVDDYDDYDEHGTGARGSRNYVFEENGWNNGPEHLDRNLAACWNIFAEKPNSAMAGLYAILFIAQYWDCEAVTPEKTDKAFGIEPHQQVEVPWWVIHQLARLYHEYVTTDGAKIGAVFGLEGGGQGHGRAVDKFRQIHEKSFLVASEVALEIKGGRDSDPKITDEDAIGIVSNRREIPWDTVRGYWQQHKQRLRARLLE